MMRYRWLFLQVVSVFLVGVAIFSGGSVSAQEPASDFSLQVTPSPLVTELKPGTETTLDLRIRNSGTGTEQLTIQPRSFTIDDNTGEVILNHNEPSEIADWVSFKEQEFTIEPGQWYTQKITISLPEDTGFSYSLVFVISRTNNPKSLDGQRIIEGSVAVFTLINVDRPGAVRQLDVEKFSTSSTVYEYLPVTANIVFRNTGNTIVRPYGNIFIQRGSDDTTPIATLPVNDGGGYILPGSKRVLDTDWTDGFPVYEITTESDGSEKKSEVWDWSKAFQFRMGHYTAKLVAVYNDGIRDVPVERQATFWVLPWKIMLIGLIVLIVLVIGVWSVLWRAFKLFRRGKRKR
tara:strand:- start:876 stop:1916 length:1041 start_codon:yes stop_codon:yes gene_type:complete